MLFRFPPSSHLMISQPSHPEIKPINHQTDSKQLQCFWEGRADMLRLKCATLVMSAPCDIAFNGGLTLVLNIFFPFFVNTEHLLTCDCESKVVCENERGGWGGGGWFESRSLNKQTHCVRERMSPPQDSIENMHHII